MRKVYLDNTATTPLISEVREAMMPYLGDIFGNPSSLHDWGDSAREAVEATRGKVAALIGANPEEIIFTGSGTESNNLAIKGLALAQRRGGMWSSPPSSTSRCFTQPEPWRSGALRSVRFPWISREWLTLMMCARE